LLAFWLGSVFAFGFGMICLSEVPKADLVKSQGWMVLFGKIESATFIPADEITSS
jgi:hypothetical protein